MAYRKGWSRGPFTYTWCKTPAWVATRYNHVLFFQAGNHQLAIRLRRSYV